MGRRGVHAAAASVALTLWLALWLCVVLLPAVVGAQSAMSVSVSGSWANATVAAAAGLHFLVTTGQDTALSIDATFAFHLHEDFVMPVGATIDAEALALSMDGSWSVSVALDSDNSHVLMVARNSDGSPVPAATTMEFHLSDVVNPSRAGVISIGTLVVSDAAKTFTVESSLPSMQIDPGAVWNAAFELENTLSGRETAVTVRLTPAHALPTGGAIVVRFPDIYGALQSIALSRIVGPDGDTTLTSKANRVVIRRVEGTGITFSGMGDVVVRLEGVVNPTFEGPVGRTVLLQTLDASDRLVDQAYVDVQSLMLSKAKVLLTTTSLAVVEGTGSQYSIWLSAPPNGSVVTVTTEITSVDPSASTIVVEPASVTFTASNWSQKAAIIVTALNDDVVIGSSTQRSALTISHALVEDGSSTTFATPDDVVIRVNEDDFPGVQLSRRFCAVIESLRNDSYELRLLSRPRSSVRVDIVPSSSTVQTLPSFIEFAPDAWNAPQVVQVRPNAASTSITASKIALSHHISSTDGNYNDLSDSVFPQDQVTVFYEPLAAESCIHPCRPGWFPLVNLSTSEAQCVGCPLGHYCPGDCSQPIPCPVGTASSAAFASSMADACVVCPSGSYAHVEGLVSCLICPAGASCTSTTRSFESCPAGTFAGENQVACHHCPAGSYNNQTFRSQCNDCPAGYYCPLGSTDPVSCADGTYSASSQASACSPCPAGYACSTADHSISRPCLRGTFSLQGDTRCHVCPPGYKCPDTDQSPQLCPTGKHNSHENATDCATCPRGSACANASSDPVACALGSFSSVENAVECLRCPAGHSCVDPSLSPILCGAGQYSLEGDYLCRACPAGMYCPDPDSSPLACTAGTYSVGSATICAQCPIGYECQRTDSAPTSCPLGFYSPNATAACLQCPAGSRCPAMALVPTRCPNGTYSDEGASVCTSCPFGYICLSPDVRPQACSFGMINNANHTACVPCPAGFDCSPLATAPTLCSSGTYSLEGDGACKLCPRGYYCALTTEAPKRCGSGTYTAADSFECHACPAGYMCAEPSVDPAPCPRWYYSLASSTQCTPCPAGMDCSSPSSLPVECSNGTYSLSTASPCLPCPAGASCSNPTRPPVACLPGTFSIEGQAQCSPCAPGHYCPYTDRNTQLPCANGTYAEAGATACTPCPAGMQCPLTTQAVEQSCPLGMFSLGGQDRCSECPRGYQCPAQDASRNAPCPLGWFSGGEAAFCTKCPAGYACPDPNIDEPVSCVSGSYSLGGAAACTPCPAGFACPDTTAKVLVACQAGTYSTGGAAECTPCPAGYECLLRNSSAVVRCPDGTYSEAGSATCVDCPRGYFCDAPDVRPQNCSVGYYSAIRATSCEPCAPGYECPRSDQLPQPCPVGYYSEGATATCRACSPGYMCSLASTNPTPPEDACPMGGYCNPPTTFFLCPAGTVGNVTAGKSLDHACAPCPEGYACAMGSTPLTQQPCLAGYYCPEGTKRASQFPCPSGTYNPLSLQTNPAACVRCPAGSYCPQASPNPTPCPFGYYCLEGTQSATQWPCPAGTFSGPQTSLTLASQCNLCELGSYCPEASSSPTKCPAGTYNPVEGAAGVHECLPCPPGWACPHSGQFEYVDRCAAGHYCPTGTVQPDAYPCPAGSYTNRIDLIRSEDCTECPERHACPQGTGGDQQPMISCAAGFFCPNGTEYATQHPCLPGTWSHATTLAAADECDICPGGKYCMGGKAYIDGDCASGHYCPLGTSSPTRFPCPSGTYTAHTRLVAPEHCDDCPPGSYCPEGSTAPIPCKPGSYTSRNNTQKVGPGAAWPMCTLCPAGYYCIEGAVTPAPCGPGKFSAAGAKSCSTCSAGYFCGDDATTDVNMTSRVGSWATPGARFGACYNGTHCPSGSVREPVLELDACPPGYYCPTATPTPLICPAGTYSNRTGLDGIDDCTPTPAGFFSTAGALAPSGECSPGFYCPERSTSRTQVPCPARYYLNRTRGEREDDCALCVAGGYCPIGTAYPVVCPAGYYCRTGVTAPAPCPIGTYANTTGLTRVEDCIACPPGQFCDATALTTPRGPCDPGYYCTNGAYTSAPMDYESTLFAYGVRNRHTGAPCPGGSYCPLGSASPTPCPLGTFSNATSLESASDCVACPAGKYCATRGLVEPTGLCQAGYYCTGGAEVATQVQTPSGHYSLDGAVGPSACAPGTFNLYPGRDKCLDCPAGYFCGKGAPGTVTPELCPTGSYCPIATSLPLLCLPGTYSDLQGLVEVKQCTACPAGSYCDSYGLSAPSGDCLEGFLCTGSSPVANPKNQTFGIECPVGHYCPKGTQTAIACPAGTFRGAISGIGLLSCSLCPGGKYCAGSALTAPTGICSAGFYCSSSAWTATPTDGVTGNACPAGFYCPEGSVAPIKCDARTFAAEIGQAVCDPCPEGFYCDGVSTDRALVCPQGFYCPPSTDATPLPCPPGSFSNATSLVSVNGCAACTPGYYCATPALLKPTGPCSPGMFCPPSAVNAYGKTVSDVVAGNDTRRECPRGFYCPEATYVPIACPEGTYSNATGLLTHAQCRYCDAGSYCGEAGLTKPSGPCAAGHYCRRNNTSPSPTTGVASFNVVTTIAANNTTGTSATTTTVSELFGGDWCPLGSYCPSGSVDPEPCPEGSYADETGLALCKPCPAGFHCGQGSVHYDTQLCPKGYYCPQATLASGLQFPCPPGTYGNRTGLQSLEQCTPAPGGMYTNEYASTQPAGICRSGFYCSGGSITATPAQVTAYGGPCLPGTNCPEASAVPIVCDAGLYCASTNTERALPCAAGYYCVQGSYTATPTGQTNAVGVIGDICTVGHYCPEGTSNPEPCPPGTYSPNTQNTRVEDCAPCPPGFLCADSGISNPTVPCTAGFYCTGGDRIASLHCPLGSECPEGSSAPRPCAAGMHADELGLESCKACPAGSYCEQGCVTPVTCPRGFYCPESTPSGTKFPCLPGTFGNESAHETAEDCAPCPPGRFCSGQAPTDAPTGNCNPGFYCSGGAMTPSPKPSDPLSKGGLCAGGFMCFQGASIPDPIDNVTGRACDAGYYCPEGSSGQIPCPKGSYNAAGRRSTCTTCPAGGYCDTNATSPAPCPLRYYCPAGTPEPILCPGGTYGAAVGLSHASECASCPSGSYCVDGRVTASCAAGFYCTVANKDPTPEEDGDFDDGTEWVGGPCPVGHYCPEGVLDPIPCPDGLARLTTQATNVDDCAPCPAGFNCASGAFTVPCPAGWYCPYSEGAHPCHEGTYNPDEGKANLEDCLPCNAGKLCNRTGILDLTNYDCPPGHYCLRGDSRPRECPAGAFRATGGAASAADCEQCMAGSFCESGSVYPQVCASQVYCPAGSGAPIVCPGGSYCPFNSSKPIVCPEGTYCPDSASFPTVCTYGHYCPSNTSMELPCPLGYIGRTPPLFGAYTSLAASCESCPPGSFGIDSNRSQCEMCTEGFVCLGATTSSHPVSKETERGYRCPSGHYCPAGSSKEQPCPSGTYQPVYQATNSSACIPCSSNSYQQQEGQASCLPCSTSAYSLQGATKCKCVGNHRAFQMSDGYCICEPGYEFYDSDGVLRSDEDGSVDCQPVVYDRCGGGQVRSDDGACVKESSTSCESVCNNGAGTYVASVGVCQCDSTPDVDSVCDSSCRAQAVQIQVNSSTGQLQLYDPVKNTIEAVSSEDATASGIVSKVSCMSGEGSECQLHSLQIASTGFSGTYEVPNVLSDTTLGGSRRRRLSSSTALANPMVCVNSGDGILFDLSEPKSYPIYMKDSMLNTNPTFDYGAFRALAAKVNAGLTTVTAFAFTFSDPGTYVFGNSLNGDARTIIVVMQSGTSCPTEAPIIPLSEKNLIAVSAKRQTDNMILAPDWSLIGGLLGGLLGLVVAVIAGLYYFRVKSWASGSMNNTAAYRLKNKQVDLGGMHSKGSIVATKDVTDVGATPGIATGELGTTSLLSGEDGASNPLGTAGSTEYQPDLSRWDDEDLDVRELVDRLQFHHETVAKCFEDQKGDARKLLQHLQIEAAELKRLFVDTLASGSGAVKREGGASTTEEGAASDEFSKHRFLVDNIERDVVARRDFRRKRTAAIDGVSKYLHDMEDWERHAPELARDLVQSMAVPVDSSTSPPEQTGALEAPPDRVGVRATLDALQALLCADPATMTSSSVAQLTESEKVRREVGGFIQQTSRRQLSGTSVDGDGQSGADVAQIFHKLDAIEALQNQEDHAVLGSLSSLQKFSVAVPQIVKAIDALEDSLHRDLVVAREEQNPSKERNAIQKMETRVSSLLRDIAASATKVGRKLERERRRLASGMSASEGAENALVATLGAAKEQWKAEAVSSAQIVSNKDVDGSQAIRSTPTSATSAVPKRSETDQPAKNLSLDSSRDDTLFQIKELLILLTSQLRSRQAPATSSISGGNVSMPLAGKQAGSSPMPFFQAAAKDNAYGASPHHALGFVANRDLVTQHPAAIPIAEQASTSSPVLIQQQIADDLKMKFPELPVEAKEHLLIDLAEDMQRMQSAMSVESFKRGDTVLSQQMASEVAQQQQKENLLALNRERELDAKKTHEDEAVDLEAKFLEEQQAIENEYLQELAALENDFGGDDEAPDFSAPPDEFPELDDLERDASISSQAAAAEALAAEMERQIKCISDRHLQAWEGRRQDLQREEKLKREQLAKRLAAKRARSDASSAGPGETAVDEEEQSQLNHIDVVMARAVHQLNDRLEDELHQISNCVHGATADAQVELENVMAKYKDQFEAEMARLQSSLTANRAVKKQVLHDRLAHRRRKHDETKAGLSEAVDVVPDKGVDSEGEKEMQHQLVMEEDNQIAAVQDALRGEIENAFTAAMEKVKKRQRLAESGLEEHERERDRVHREHDESLKALQVALDTERARQHDKLKERSAKKRAERLAEGSSQGEDAAARIHQELDEEEAQERERLDQVLAEKAAQALDAHEAQFKEVMDQAEAEVTKGRIQVEAEEAARIALDAARHAELDRLAREFYSGLASLRDGDSLAALGRRQALQKRLEERKQKRQTASSAFGSDTSLPPLVSELSSECSAVLVDEAEQEIRRVFDQHREAWQSLQDQIDIEARSRKEQLADRISRKRAKLARAAEGGVGAAQILKEEEELQQEAIAEAVAIDDGAVAQRRAVLNQMQRQETETSNTVADSMGESKERLQLLLEETNRRHAEGVNALRSELERERQRQELLLQSRIAKRREQKGVPAAELGAADAHDRQNLEAQIKEKEEKQLAEIHQNHAAEVDSLLKSEESNAQRRSDLAKQAEIDAEAELKRVREEHARHRRELEENIAAEKERQRAALEDKLRQKRAARIAAASGRSNGRVNAELDASEDQERAAFEAEHAARESEERAQLLQVQTKQEAQVIGKLCRASGDRAAAAVALDAIDAARLQASQIIYDFERNRTLLAESTEADRLAQKAALAARIAARKRHERLGSNDDDRSQDRQQSAAGVVKSIDKPPRPEGSEVEQRVARQYEKPMTIANAMADALEDELAAIKATHASSMASLMEHLEREAAMKKAQLAERIKARKRALAAAAKEGTTSSTEMEQAESAIREEEAQAMSDIERESEQKKHETEQQTAQEQAALTQALRVEVERDSDEMERAIAACKAVHAEETLKLRESLRQSRLLQEETLKERLAKKRAARALESGKGGGDSRLDASLAEVDAQEDAADQAALARSIETEEQRQLEALASRHRSEVNDVAERLKNEQAAKREAAQKEQETAALELERVRKEHERELVALQALMAAERKRQDDKLREKLAKRRAEKQKELAKLMGAERATAERDLQREEEHAVVVMEAQASHDAQEAVEDMLSRQRAKEQTIAEALRRAAVDVAAAGAAQRALEKVREDELVRIASEFEHERLGLRTREAVDKTQNKQRLQDRLAQRKMKKKLLPASGVGEDGDILGELKPVPALRASSFRKVVQRQQSVASIAVDQCAESEIQKLQSEHERAWMDRCAALDQEAALRRAQLSERMQKKRARLAVTVAEAEMTAEAKTAADEALATEESRALEEISADVDAQKQQLQAQLEAAQREISATIQEAARKEAEEMDRMLAACKQSHDDETKRLEAELQRERQLQEAALQDRIARRREKKSLQASKAREGREIAADDDTTPVVVKGERPSTAEVVDEEREKKRLEDELAAKEAQAWAEVRRKQEEELQALSRRAKAIAAKKQEDARALQRHAEEEMERLRREHEDEMRRLASSLEVDQKRQEERLQQRIAQRRAQREKQAATSQAASASATVDASQADREAQERAQLMEMEEQERRQLEEELASNAARLIEEEQARQRQREQEVASRIAQAAIDAAAADAAKKALEMSSAQEIARLSREFEDNIRALQQSDKADTAAQKKKLEARIAAKKQKKMMELEAKKELERQRLRQKQQQEAEALERSTVEAKARVDLLEVMAQAQDGDSAEPSAMTTVLDTSAQDARPPVELSPSVLAMPEAAAAAIQQQQDVEAVARLFEHALIPQKLTLMGGIELVVRYRHQSELAQLMAICYEAKMVAVRDALGTLVQEKATAKARAMAGARVQSAALDAIDSEYEAQFRQVERRVVEEMDRSQALQTKKLQERHLQQIAFLLEYFGTRNAKAASLGQAASSDRGDSDPEWRPRRGVVYLSDAESLDSDDLEHALRLRLRVETDERVEQLQQDKQRALEALDNDERQRLEALDRQYTAIVDEETAAMKQLLAGKGEQSAATQAERGEQLSRLVVMLEGRKKKQALRVQELFKKQRAVVEDEYRRKIQAVSAAMMERLVQEKEMLRKKQALLKASDGGERVDGDGTGASVKPVLDGELEARLVHIEEMLREKMDDEKAHESSVDAYRLSVVDAIVSGCRWSARVSKRPSLSLQVFGIAKVTDLHLEQVQLVSEDKKTPLMRSRCEFAAYSLQLLDVSSPSTVPSSSRAVVLVAELPGSGEEKALISFDASKRALYVSTAAIHNLSSGQLAVLILHALAEARTGSDDVTSPEFVAAVYELLVRCYQNLFALFANENSSGSFSSKSASSSVSTLVHNHRAAPKARSKAANEWSDRLREMESFLGQLESEPTSGSPDVAPVAPLLDAARRQLPGSRSLSRWNLLRKTDTAAASPSSLASATAGGSSNDLDDLMRQERAQLLLEKLDTAEKLYSHVLRQLQEQGEAREYVLEMLEEERARAADAEEQDAETPPSASGALQELEQELRRADEALEDTRKERDDLFAQCQALRRQLSETCDM